MTGRDDGRAGWTEGRAADRLRQFIEARLPSQQPDDIGEDSAPAGLETGDGGQAGGDRNEESSG